MFTPPPTKQKSGSILLTSFLGGRLSFLILRKPDTTCWRSLRNNYLWLKHIILQTQRDPDARSVPMPSWTPLTEARDVWLGLWQWRAGPAVRRWKTPTGAAGHTRPPGGGTGGPQLGERQPPAQHARGGLGRGDSAKRASGAARAWETGGFPQVPAAERTTCPPDIVGHFRQEPPIAGQVDQIHVRRS